MRKMLMALCLALFAAGVVVADPVTLVKYNADKKEVTVKDKDGKEATYKLTEATKYTVVDADGVKKERTAEQVTKMLSSEKAAGKARFDITVSGGAITELTTKAFKKKAN